MNIQFVIIIIIIAGAVAYAAKRVYDSLNGKGGCNCTCNTDCSSCHHPKR